MRQPLSFRAILQALLPAVALVMFVYIAVRNPQRAPIAILCAVLAASVLYTRIRSTRRR
jgi:hypothetical protein